MIETQQSTSISHLLTYPDFVSCLNTWSVHYSAYVSLLFRYFALISPVTRDSDRHCKNLVPVNLPTIFRNWIVDFLRVNVYVCFAIYKVSLLSRKLRVETWVSGSYGSYFVLILSWLLPLSILRLVCLLLWHSCRVFLISEMSLIFGEIDLYKHFITRHVYLSWLRVLSIN